MALQVDRRFSSLTEAYTYILGQYSLQPNESICTETRSGLAYPRELPCYLFRGECGDFPMTTDGGRRLEAACLTEGFPLSSGDMLRLGKLIYDLAVKLTEKLDDLDLMSAFRRPSRTLRAPGTQSMQLRPPILLRVRAQAAHRIRCLLRASKPLAVGR
jgi:hypothetical protein